MSQCLVMFGWKKTRCLTRVLAALAKCRGIERWPIKAFVDGDGDPEVARIFQRNNIMPQVHLNRYGCSGNISIGLQTIFESGMERIIVIEDDVLVAPDAIEWLEARLEDQQNNPKVMSVGLWRHNDQEAWLPGKGEMPEGAMAGFKAVLGFHCWGWATWADRWKPYFKKLLFPLGGDSYKESWDVRLNTYAGENDLRVTLPHISRAQNIGNEFQTHIGATILPFWTGEKIK